MTLSVTAVTQAMDRVEKVLSWVLVALMALMVLDVTWQVVSRFVLRDPSSFTEELAGFLLIWIGLLGAAYGFRTRAHLSIELLVDRLGGRARRSATLTAHALVLLFAVSTMVVGGTRLVALAFQLRQISAAVGVPMGFVYLVLPLSGALIVLFSAESMVEVASRRAHR